jgi:hypothetical protein
MERHLMYFHAELRRRIAENPARFVREFKKLPKDKNVETLFSPHFGACWPNLVVQASLLKKSIWENISKK